MTDLSVPLMALAGVVIGGFITSWPALRGHRINKENAELQARLTANVKLAEFRQAWINNLRNDMADFQARSISYRPGVDNFEEIHKIGSRIELHINPKDKLLPALRDSMAACISSNTPQQKIDANGQFVSICAKILNAEWKVLKKEVKSVASDAESEIASDATGVKTIDHD